MGEMGRRKGPRILAARWSTKLNTLETVIVEKRTFARKQGEDCFLHNRPIKDQKLVRAEVQW
jgi:hypothetical protein